MGHQYIQQENVNIDNYPQLDADHQLVNGLQVSLGDLHGNFQKLLYAGVRHGALKTTPEDFTRFAAIYAKKPLQAADIKQFNELLARIQVNPKSNDSLLRLIGDVMADRGANDYLTLKLLQKFKQGGLPFENLLSNHDAEFIALFESGQPFNYSRLGGQANSANELHDLIDRNLVSRDEINALIEECYKPSLKALSYSFDEAGKLTVYSHAAIGTVNIRYMSDALNLPWLGNDDPSIAKTIDAINIEFAKHVQNNTVTKLIGLDQVPMNAINGKQPIDGKKFPFAHLIWNRDAKGLNRPEHMNWVHGHDMSDKTIGNIFNLDNQLGKAPGIYHTGIYNALYSKVTGLKPAMFLPEIIDDYQPIAAIYSEKSTATIKPVEEMLEKDWEFVKPSDLPVSSSQTTGIWKPFQSIVGVASNWWWGAGKEESPIAVAPVQNAPQEEIKKMNFYDKRGERLEGPIDLTQSIIGLPEGTTFKDYTNRYKKADNHYTPVFDAIGAQLKAAKEQGAVITYEQSEKPVLGY